MHLLPTKCDWDIKTSSCSAHSHMMTRVCVELVHVLPTHCDVGSDNQLYQAAQALLVGGLVL